MKVLYFTRHYTTHDRRFLERLASLHEIYFLRLEDDGVVYERRPLPSGVIPVAWRGGHGPAKDVTSWLGLMSDLERVLLEVQPDLVHAGPVQSCGFLMALTGFQPLIITSWGSDMLVDAERDEMWRWLTRFALRRAAAALTDCDAVTRRVLQCAPHLEGHVIQFPWGTDLKRFAPGPDRAGLRDRFGLSDRIVILSTRSWEKSYGTDTLLEAFRSALRANPRLALILLGDGSLAPYVRTMISAPDLADAVRAPGMVSEEELPDYFRSADLYLSCTPQDGSSVSLIEALASGLPVVVADADGNREWVAPGANGWLVPAGDVGRWSRVILDAASATPEERRSMGRRNRALAELRADWDGNIAMLLAGYEELRGATARPLGAANQA